MKIRITALILAMVMLLMMFSGCGKTEEKTETTRVAATTERPTTEPTMEFIHETTVETKPISRMLPKVAYLYFLEERDTSAWQFVWRFHWNEYGYLTEIEAEKIKNGKSWDCSLYYVKENDGWYDGGFLHGEFDDVYPDLFSGPYSHSPGEGIPNEYVEGDTVIGFGHTSICTMILDTTREKLYPERIYNNIPDDYTYDENESRKWLYADFTYDEYGNPIRIDTYNLEEELCGYVEVEWMEIEIKP